MADLRTLERDSIRSFVESCAEYFSGRVLDYGAGMMPYRDVIEGAGGVYVPYDHSALPGFAGDPDYAYSDLLYQRDHHSFDAVLVTQSLQYMTDPRAILESLLVAYIKRHGVLAMTGPTTWPEVEEADLCRFTRAGILHLLVDVGFVVERLERRAEVSIQGEVFSLGWGVVARA